MEDTNTEPAVVEDGDSSTPDTPQSAGVAADASHSAGSSSAPAAASSDSVYHAFRTLPQFNGLDDRAIASHLYQAMQREEAATRALRQYQSVVPEYLSNREAFEQWKASRNAPQQAAPEPPKQEPSWWNPPQVRDAFKQYLVKDENGREVISPDAPLDARHALVEYQQYKADFAKRFLENPEQTLGPMVEKVAADRAAAIVQEQFGRYQAQQYVSNLEQSNRDWLFDESGNVSAEGRAAQEYIEQAKALGIKGPKERWDFAVAMVERDLLNRHYHQAQVRAAMQPMPQPAPQAPVQKSVAEQNMEFMRQQAARRPSQTTPETTDPRVPKPAKTFAQRLSQEAKSAGLLDRQ